MQFANSLWTRDRECICLFGEDRGSPGDLRDLRDLRDLLKILADDRGRWKSQVFIAAALAELGVKSAATLEREVMKLTPDLAYPVDRPHLFDRMQLGQPQIDRVMRNLEHTSRRWVDLLLQITTRPIETLSLPVWRLLDPTPLTWFDYQECCGQVMVSVLRQMRKFPAPESLTNPALRLREICDFPEAERGDQLSAIALEFQRLGNSPGVEQFMITMDVDESGLLRQPAVLPRPTSSDLHSLSCLLLSLRYWEMIGDLESYFLTLHEAIELLQRSDLEADLQAMGHHGPSYLRLAFGRIVMYRRPVSGAVPVDLEQAMVNRVARRRAYVQSEPAELKLDAKRTVRFHL